MSGIAMQRDLIGVQAGSADPQARDTSNQTRSGAALRRMDEMAAMSRSEYLWDASNVAMTMMGHKWLPMARYVYDSPGRVMYLPGEMSHLGDQGVIIGIPFIRDANGKPIPVDVPEEVHTLPNPQNPQLQDLVFRFNPPTDYASVRTFSLAMTTTKKETMIEWLLSLAPTAPEPLQAHLWKMIFNAAQEFMPVGDIPKALENLAPSPPGAAMDSREAPSMVAFLQQRLQQSQQQLQEAVKKGEPAQAARDVAGLNAEKDIEIAKLRAQVEVYKANLQRDSKREDLMVREALADDQKTAALEQKREQGMIDAAVKLDDSAMALESEERMAREGHTAAAALEGMKAGSAVRARTAKSESPERPKEKSDGGSTGS